VSAGIKASFCGATATDQGVLVVAQMPASVAPSGLNGLNLAQISAVAQYCKVVPLRNGAKITWRPCDYDDQGAFAAVSASAGTITTVATVSRPYIFAFTFGAAASSAPMLLEHVTNWEGQFKDPTFSPGGLNETMGGAPAVTGWFEKFQNIIRFVEPIVPLFMGNGYEAPRMITGTKRGHPSIEELVD